MFFKSKLLSSVEFIVAGLGNPGKQYERTRHNAGFIALDLIAANLNCKLNTVKFKSYASCHTVNSVKILLMKPATFMNNSGQAVLAAMDFYKIPPERTIIIYDDVSLETGKIRIREKGSDGGQNGMKNIIYLSGQNTFPRIRIGIGPKPNPNWDLADWVLSKLSDSEYNTIIKAAENVWESVQLIITGNVDKAMNLYN